MKEDDNLPTRQVSSEDLRKSLGIDPYEGYTRTRLKNGMEVIAGRFVKSDTGTLRDMKEHIDYVKWKQKTAGRRDKPKAERKKK